MYKQCRTEQSAARQRELEQGLLEAMAQQHYDEITVSSLCQQLGIPRKSFYRYFSSKEGALNALIDHALMDFVSFTEEQTDSLGNSSAADTELMFAYWKFRKPLLDALDRSSLSGVLIQRAVEQSMVEAINARRFLSVDEKYAQEYSTLFAVSGFMSMVIQWHHDGYPQNARQMAQIARRLVTEPLAPELK